MEKCFLAHQIYHSYFISLSFRLVSSYSCLLYYHLNWTRSYVVLYKDLPDDYKELILGIDYHALNSDNYYVLLWNCYLNEEFQQNFINYLFRCLKTRDYSIVINYTWIIIRGSFFKSSLLMKMLKKYTKIILMYKDKFINDFNNQLHVIILFQIIALYIIYHRSSLLSIISNLKSRKLKKIIFSIKEVFTCYNSCFYYIPFTLEKEIVEILKEFNIYLLKKTKVENIFNLEQYKWYFHISYFTTK